MASQRERDARQPAELPPADAGALRMDARAEAEEAAEAVAVAGADTTAADAERGRAGQDERRRGWFWHWNSVVTQYAPLIGLKGVGLLNSYTVWTDRREESPHRGYAFPSQQSEADFYGEDRSELITINKILVALDLIEIRKEMIARTDERGRRWRVPHNLYRVRDRPDGMTLRAADVLRVAQLAATDAAVFRHVRRVFSERFQPIDRDNVWHSILADVANDPVWQAQRQRALELERRASARTRAGHRTRAERDDIDSHDVLTGGQLAGVASTDDGQTDAGCAPSDSVVAGSNDGFRPLVVTSDAPSNSASGVVVAASNRGSADFPSPSVARVNQGQPTAVGAGNTTYDQPPFTTTTTTTVLAGDAEAGRAAEAGAPTSTPVAVSRNEHSAARQVGDTSDGQPARIGARDRDELGATGADERQDRRAAGDDGDPLADRDGVAGRQSVAAAVIIERDDEFAAGAAAAGNGAADRRADRRHAGGPLVDPSPLVLSLYEAANDRRARPLERDLLAELERDADPAARAAGSSGVDWVAAALREAVASGSTFVAPKYLREIINRWAASGGPLAPLTPASGVMPQAPAAPDAAADVRLPGGASATTVWSAVLGDLARLLDAAAFERLLAGSTITRYWRGTVEVTVASPAVAGKLDAEYRALIERQLNARLKRPVDLRFHASHAAEAAESETPCPAVPAVLADPTAQRAGDPTLSQRPAVVVIDVAPDDLAIGRQLWRALLDDPALALPAVERARLADAALLGERADGVFLLGVTTRAASVGIERHRATLEPVLARLLGRAARLATLGPEDWRETPSSRPDS